MESDSGYREKMDALDLVMNALKDHERQLDKLSRRLEQAFKKGKTGELSAIEAAPEPPPREAPPRRRPPQVRVRRWDEFTSACRDATLTAFTVEGNQFHIDTAVGESIFTYEESLPTTQLPVVETPAHISVDKKAITTVDALLFLIEGKLKCGLTLRIHSSSTRLQDREHLLTLHYELPVDTVKTFLSKELGVPKDRVIEGRITL